MRRVPGLSVTVPLNPNIQPVQQPMQKLPLNLVPLIQNKIEELLEKDVIEEVKHSRWTSRLVPVWKADRTLRMCVDMRDANKAIVVERYPLPTLESLTARMSGSRVFTVLDLKDAFHHVELEESSRDITAFRGPDGRLFRYKALMFGIRTGSEKFQSVIEQHILVGLDGVEAFIDDIIIHGKDDIDHDKRLKKVLERLDVNQMTLNMSKCQIKQQQVIFMGHVISQQGVKPTPDKIEAIESFRCPKNKSELKSFLGLVLYVGARFEPSLAAATSPLRELLTRNERFEWGSQQQEAFEALKQLIKTALGNGFYKRGDETTLYADAGPEAAGAVLIQKDEHGEQRPVACASRAFSGPERNYSQLEKEALALVWAVRRFDYYLAGSKFILVTDHKPLEVLFKSQTRASARVTRWRLAIQEYDFVIKYKSGEKNIADPFSRLATGQDIGVEAHEAEEEYVMALAEMDAVGMEEIAVETSKDETLQKVLSALQEGAWPEDDALAAFKRCQVELSVVKGILLRSFCVVPPKVLRNRILQNAHEGHPGIVKMKGRLRQDVWWPGIDEEIARLVNACLECRIVGSANPPLPMQRHALPLEAWQEVAADLMGPLPTGETLLVVVDYFSRYPEVVILEETKAATVIKSLQDLFARWGNPRSIRMDNGPQFACTEMKEYLKSENIKAEYSPPYWPRANGQVERMNRDLKLAIQRSLNEGKEWRKGLAEHLKMYRSSPHATTGRTPAELMFKRRMRGKLPVAEDLVEVRLDMDLADRDQRLKEKGKEYGDAFAHARDADVIVGSDVIVKRAVKASKWTPNFNPTVCKVVARQNGRLTVQAPSGKEYDRAVSHVKKITQGDGGETSSTAEGASESSDDPATTECQNDPGEVSNWTPTAMSTPHTDKRASRLELQELTHEPGPSEDKRRPRRDCKRPRALDDYELYVMEEGDTSSQYQIVPDGEGECSV